jgi:F-type H+-transporting ATPase subunit c
MQVKKVFASLFVVVSSMLISVAAFAEESAEVAEASMGDEGMKAIAAALAIGLAAVAGAFSQARAATAALEGIARNPNASKKLFVPMILALALIESLVIYALLIAFMIV